MWSFSRKGTQMQLEAISKPLRYRLRTGEEILLRPGIPVELPDLAAQKLLAQAPDRVRLVPYAVEVGQTIQWCSPLFGNLKGAVLLNEGDNLLVDHPTIGQPAWICRSWIIAKEASRDRKN